MGSAMDWKRHNYSSVDYSGDDVYPGCLDERCPKCPEFFKYLHRDILIAGADGEEGEFYKAVARGIRNAHRLDQGQRDWLARVSAEPFRLGRRKSTWRDRMSIHLNYILTRDGLTKSGQPPLTQGQAIKAMQASHPHLQDEGRKDAYKRAKKGDWKPVPRPGWQYNPGE